MSKRLTAKVGEYQKDGETKGRYVNIGAMLSNANGEYLLLDPSVSLSGVLAQQNAMSDTPRSNVMVSIFDSDYQGQQKSRPEGSQKASQGFDDDTPF